MEKVIALGIFLLVLFFLVTGYLIFAKPKVRSVKRSVERYGGNSHSDEEIDILYRRKFSAIPLINKVLGAFQISYRIDDFLQSTGLKITVELLFILSIASGALGFLLTVLFTRNTFLNLVIGVLAFFLPIIVLNIVRQQRVKKFEALFPDALDLMGYGLRSGYSVMAGLKMVADEMNDPVGPEFTKIVEEVNFGRGLDKALHNFSMRVGSDEAKYFATSLIIQRETGGNLAELLDGVAAVIRKRFRFREKVRALSAEGRFSGYILTATPFILAGTLYILSPGYMEIMFDDPIGPYLIGIALILMAIGGYVIHRLVQIDL